MIGLSGAMSGVGRCNSDTVLITDVGVLLQYVACSRSLARLGTLYLRITEINISLFYVASRQPFIRRNMTRPLRPIFLGGGGARWPDLTVLSFTWLYRIIGQYVYASFEENSTVMYTIISIYSPSFWWIHFKVQCLDTTVYMCTDLFILREKQS